MAKSDLYNHPKLKMLMNLSKEKMYEVVGRLQILWDSASMRKNPIFTGDEIEALIEWDGVPGEYVGFLHNVGFIDKVTDNVYFLHDFYDHCPNYCKSGIELQNLPAVIYQEGIKKRNIGQIYEFEFDEIKRIVNTFYGVYNGDYVKVTSMLLDEYVERYGDDYEIRDLIRYILDCRYNGKEKGLGEIKNERAYFVGKLKEYLDYPVIRRRKSRDVRYDTDEAEEM